MTRHFRLSERPSVPFSQIIGTLPYFHISKRLACYTIESCVTDLLLHVPAINQAFTELTGQENAFTYYTTLHEKKISDREWKRFTLLTRKTISITVVFPNQLELLSSNPRRKLPHLLGYSIWVTFHLLDKTDSDTYLVFNQMRKERFPPRAMRQECESGNSPLPIKAKKE